MVFSGKGVLVDGEDDGLEIFASRGRDDDLLGTGLDVGHGFLFAAVESSALQDDVYAKFAPRELIGFWFGINGDFLAVDGDGTRDFDGLSVLFELRLFGSNGMSILSDDAGISALGCIILQEVGEHLRAREIVDGDDFVSFCSEHLTEGKTADTTEAVNCNFY